MKRFAVVFLQFGSRPSGDGFRTASAPADEIKMVGVITKIDIAGKDAKTARRPSRTTRPRSSSRHRQRRTHPGQVQGSPDRRG